MDLRLPQGCAELSEFTERMTTAIRLVEDRKLIWMIRPYWQAVGLFRRDPLWPQPIGFGAGTEE